MNSISLNNGVKVSKVPLRGKGIVSLRKFKKGDIIEIAPVIIFSSNDGKFIEQSQLRGYTFGWGRGKKSALAMGCGSFYNHSYNPNAKYQSDYDSEVIEFVAIKDIEENEEITINYNGSPKNKKPLWFEVI